MSLASKITLAAACVASAGIIAYVHHEQKLERERLHQGVIRDMERQRLKNENTYKLQQQSDIANQLSSQYNKSDAVTQQ